MPKAPAGSAWGRKSKMGQKIKGDGLWTGFYRLKRRKSLGGPISVSRNALRKEKGNNNIFFFPKKK